MSETKEDKILDRVRALLAVAEHPNTGADEADTAMKMANSLMAKYAIDEAVARANMDENQRKAPTVLKFPWSTAGSSEFYPMLRSILNQMAAANRCRLALYMFGEAEVFGMEQDVKWVEMLYISAYTQFLSQINPKWDTAKGYDENVYNFKVAGYKWLAINAEAMKHGERDTRIWTEREGNAYSSGRPAYYDGEFRNLQINEEKDRWGVQTAKWESPTEKTTGVLKAAYKRHAAKIGDTTQVTTSSHREYRRQYSEAFGARLNSRLQAMQRDNDGAARYAGAEVALLDVKHDVDATFYAAYPQFKPETQMEEARMGRERRQAMLNAMTDKQRHDFLEKEQRAARAQAQRDRKYWEKQNNNFQEAAHNRGRKAADTVDLSRKAGFAEEGSRTGGQLC